MSEIKTEQMAAKLGITPKRLRKIKNKLGEACRGKSTHYWKEAETLLAYSQYKYKGKSEADEQEDEGCNVVTETSSEEPMIAVEQFVPASQVLKEARKLAKSGEHESACEKYELFLSAYDFGV